MREMVFYCENNMCLFVMLAVFFGGNPFVVLVWSFFWGWGDNFY